MGDGSQLVCLHRVADGQVYLEFLIRHTLLPLNKKIHMRTFQLSDVSFTFTARLRHFCFAISNCIISNIEQSYVDKWLYEKHHIQPFTTGHLDFLLIVSAAS